MRQYIVGDYIADFFAPDAGLIIEVDGGYHAERKQQEYDEIRTEDINNIGFNVIRFSNEEVLYDTENVIDKILETIDHYE